MIKNIFFLLAALSCVSTPKVLDPQIYYAHDLRLTVNGHESLGTIVVPKSEKYSLKIVSPGKMSLFILETCHREIPLEDIGRREKMDITPVVGIENEPSCSMMKISAFDKRKARHAWGMVLAENEMYRLPAKVKCNGKQWESNGSTICQSKDGKYQVIEFPVKVKAYGKGCPVLVSKDGFKFIYKIPNRECVFAFQEVGSPKRRHYLVTIGYERYPVRE